MAAFMTDGDFTTAVAVGKPRVSFPIPGDAATTIIEQDYMILFANFAALALDTAHGTFTTSYLIEETPLIDLGGGVARWTRIYSKIPANRTEYSTYAYNYIGYWGSLWSQTVQSNSVNGRERFTKTSLSKTLYTYYLPGVTVGITTPSDIAVVESQKYYVASSNNVMTDILADSPVTPASVPTRAAYEALITADASAGSFSIVAEDSKLIRWRGNIYERSVVYVKAY